MSEEEEEIDEEKKEEKKEEVKEPEPEEDDNIFSHLTKFRFGEKVLNKKRKRTKIRKQLKDDVEDALSYINYNKLTKFEDIKSYLQEKLRDFSTKDNVEFIQQIIKSKIYNTNINLNDILGGRCFNVYIGKFGYKATSYVFTADNLYWIANMYEQLKSERNQLMGIVNMKEKYVNVQAINRDNVSYEKGYINDHSKDFSIIGFECFDQNIQNAIKEGKIPENATKGSFGIRNVNYNYYLYKNGACIVAKAANEEADITNDLKTYMLSYNVVGSKRLKQDEKGIKLYEIGTNKNVYISQKIKLTDYWPCEIVFSKPLVYSVLYKFDIDMVKYEEYILKNFVDSEKDIYINLGDFFKFNNIIDFNNFSLMINFLTVEVLSNIDNVKYPQLRNKYIQFMNDWKPIRNSFNIIKKNLTFFLKLFDSFFCSFRDKISYRAFKRINKMMTKRLGEFKTSFNEKDKYGKNIYEIFAYFLTKYNLQNVACTILNACNRADDIFNIAQSIASLSQEVVLLNSSDIYGQMQAIGHSIFEMYIKTENSTSHLINEIRTPSLYLGDLLAPKSKVAKGIIEEYEASVEEKKDDGINRLDQLATFSSIKDIDAKKYAIGLYFTDKKLKDVFEKTGIKCELKGEYNKWYETVKGKITSTNPIVVYGKSLLVGGEFAKGIDMATPAKEELENYYKSYVSWVKANKAEEEKEKAEGEKEKADAKIKGTKKKEKKEKKEKIEKKEKSSDVISTHDETEINFEDLEGEEKDNYTALLEAKITREQIIDLVKKNEDFLKNKDLVQGMILGASSKSAK